MVPETPYGEGFQAGYCGMPYRNRFFYKTETVSHSAYFDGYEAGVRYRLTQPQRQIHITEPLPADEVEKYTKLLDEEVTNER